MDMPLRDAHTGVLQHRQLEIQREIAQLNESIEQLREERSTNRRTPSRWFGVMRRNHSLVLDETALLDQVLDLRAEASRIQQELRSRGLRD